MAKRTLIQHLRRRFSLEDLLAPYTVTKPVTITVTYRKKA